MITLDTHNITLEGLGKDHGLDIKEAYQAYGQQLATAVSALWQNPSQPGAWRDWLILANDTQLIEDINRYAKSIHGQFDHLIIVGIGGSALGPLAAFEALLPAYWNERTHEQRQGKPKYYFVDNVDPDKLYDLLQVVDIKRTLVNVITKSGTTSETMAGYLWLKAELEKAVGTENVAKHLVMTTDPEKGLLRKIATEEGIIAFPVPADVGGRYSEFSSVGLVPAAILGISLEEFCKGMKDLTPSLQSTDMQTNPAMQGALIQYLCYQKGQHISVLMPYAAKLASTADWYVQLWAESLGKKVNLQGQVVHEGPTPHKAVGVTDQHSQVQLFNEGPFDKIITFVRLGQFEHHLTIPNLYPENPDLNYLGNQDFGKLLQAEADATRASLTKNGKANITLTLPKLDAYHFAQLLFLLEVQTALMGSLLNIDPFNQPGVELGKQYTYALMGRPGFENLKDEASGKIPQTAL